MAAIRWGSAGALNRRGTAQPAAGAPPRGFSWPAPIGHPSRAPFPALQCASLTRAALQAKLASRQPKLYPNLNPAAALPVDPEEIFKLHNFFGHYRLQRGSQPAQYVPNLKYIFVQLPSGETLLHPRHRHPAIAGGKPVLYAGEAYFDNGALQWWSNGSGNYRPDAGHAEQTDLPMERFYTFEEILNGAHKGGRKNE